MIRTGWWVAVGVVGLMMAVPLHAQRIAPGIQAEDESEDQNRSQYAQATALDRAASPGEASSTAVGATRSDRGSSKRNYNPIRDRRFYVGLAYPGALVGFQGHRYAVELRMFKQNDVTIYGPRFTHKWLPFRGGNFYWALDAQYVSDFEGEITEGDGLMGGAVLGLEKYLGSRVSFTVDGGPYYLTIEDDLSGVDVDGMEFVVNTSLSVHF